MANLAPSWTSTFMGASAYNIAPRVFKEISYFNADKGFSYSS
jgi:hypothetical protein